jgi:hypothetical protein
LIPAKFICFLFYALQEVAIIIQVGDKGLGAGCWLCSAAAQ